MAKPIQGTKSGNTLNATAGNDKLLGHDGDDIFDFTTTGGNDTVHGQGGMDTAIFRGRYEDYVVSVKDTGNLKTTVTGNSSDVELKHVETLLFDNATYDVRTGAVQITTVSVSDSASVSEGAADPHLNFTFTRTGDLARELDVAYTLDGTATAGSDYAAPASHIVHFDAGSNTAVLSLAVTNDMAVESSETVGVHLAADSHYNFGAQANATGTILDNDTPPASPVLHISSPSAAEGGNLVFRVSIDAPTDHDITFVASTMTGANPIPGGIPASFGTATAGNLPGGDFDGFGPTPPLRTIHAGQTYVDISVHTRTDLLIEPDETMSLRLSTVTGATITPGLGTSRGEGTILDVQPTHVSIYADPNDDLFLGQFNFADEGSDFVFHFHRDAADAALDVNYTIGGVLGATPGVDFTAADGATFTETSLGSKVWTPSMPVHFDAGVTDVDLVFHAVNDGMTEVAEALTVNFDFAHNDPSVLFDGAGSQALYLAAGGTNPTQVNIVQIYDLV